MATRKPGKNPSKAAAKSSKYADGERAAPLPVAEETASYAQQAPTAAGSNLGGGQGDGLEEFHAITRLMEGMSDEAQVNIIRHGLSAGFARSLGQAFSISVGELAKVLLVSESTLTRKSRDNALLDPSATERMMRIAAITALATEVFEAERKATTWMTRTNVALGGQTPLSLCDNDISAGQVRRVLRAIEYGGVV